MWRKVLGVLAGLLVLVVGGAAIFVASRQNLKFTAPSMAVAASTDSSVIARGHYVVRTVAGCASCHGDPKQLDALNEGAEIPLSGGFEFKLPLGVVRVPNITPDTETGIGAFSDAAIAQALRHGIGHDGRALLPFMEFQEMSDEDLVAVVSYLRTQAPVSNAVAKHEWNLLGKVIKATALAEPKPGAEPAPGVTPRGATVENGRYLVNGVALCFACHSKRSLQDGSFIGPKLAGTNDFVDEKDPTIHWAPANLTPDPETGRTGQWTEDEFVTRFRAGRTIPGSPMPWQSFGRMDEHDLRAMYRYLKTVPPVKNDVGPPFTKVEARK